ncbi:DUF5958 family protein [Streptomyces mirabilis]
MRYFHAEEAIARSVLRPTYMPTVMLTRWRLNTADLPSYDRARALRLLVALFAIADVGASATASAGAAMSGTSWPLAGMPGRPLHEHPSVGATPTGFAAVLSARRSGAPAMC